jgi:hypothetical protein
MNAKTSPVATRLRFRLGNVALAKNAKYVVAKARATVAIRAEPSTLPSGGKQYAR